MSEPLRVLFCMGINQNFFDLPTGMGGLVWKGFVTLMTQMEDMDGVQVIGNMDDDSHMVGPSTGWPWTCYVLADVVDQPAVKAVCNLLRTIEVGEHTLWRYVAIEARIGRALTVRPEVDLDV